MLQHLVRVSSGFSGYYGCDLGLTLSLYLTIMVHPPQISTYTGAEKRRGRPALATREQPMATALVSVETREVVRCEYCALVQYRTSNSLCRKCHRPLDIEEPYALGPQPVPSPLPFSAADAGLHVAAQVRDIRKARHLSQRQLASRMQVEGILVRSLVPWGIPNGVRITIAMPEQNERFLYTLKRTIRQSVAL